MQLSDFFPNGPSVGSQVIYADLPITDNVVQGDLLTVLVGGSSTYALPPSDPDGTLRPLSLTPDTTAMAPYTTVVTTANIAGNAQLLANGNVIVPTIQASTSYPQFTVYAPNGTVVVGPSVIEPNALINETGPGTKSIRARALVGGGFVVTYLTAAGLRYAVFDNAGGVVLAVATFTASCSRVMQAVALSGGGFAILWMFSSGGFNVLSAAFNAAGAQVGVTAAVETIAAAETFLTGTLGASAVQWNTTGYAVAYDFTTGSGANHRYRVAFFNNVGLQIGASVTVTGGATVGNQKMASTSDGGVAFVWVATAANSNKIIKYSSAGAVLGGPTSFDASGTAIVAFAVQSTPGIGAGTFAVFYAYTGVSDLLQTLWTAAGAISGGITTYVGATSGGGLGAMTNMDSCVLTDGTYYVGGIGNSNNQKCPRLDAALTTVLNVGAISTVDGTGVVCRVLPIVNPQTSQPCAFMQKNASAGNTLYIVTALILARSPIGAATAAFAAPGPAHAVVYGPGALRTAWVPQVFDTRGATPLGQKGWLIGETVDFVGIQAP